VNPQTAAFEFGRYRFKFGGHDPDEQVRVVAVGEMRDEETLFGAA